MKELTLLLSFLSDFKEDAKKYHVSVDSIKLTTADLTVENAVGKATFDITHWTVEIDSSFMSWSPKTYIKSVVYHELGHTIGLLHTTERDIMNPDFLGKPSRRLIKKMFSTTGRKPTPWLLAHHVPSRFSNTLITIPEKHTLKL